MKTIYDRTRMLVGTGNLEKIKKKKVIIFGVGGVGGYVTEALARAGVGGLTLVDFDVVDITNINRQIIALQSTIGIAKVEVMKQRILDINPDIEVSIFCEKLLKENIHIFQLEQFDYVIDAIDDVKAKLFLIQETKKLKIPILSSMGTGNKTDPTQFKIADIKKTNTCPLARVIRKELRELGINDLKVLFSTEQPHREEYPEDGSKAPASISFGPATAGLIIAAEVFKDLLNHNME